MSKYFDYPSFAGLTDGSEIFIFHKAGLDYSPTISSISLGSLGDVDTTGITNGSALIWNNTNGAWEIGVAGGNPFDQDLNTDDSVGFTSVVADGDILATDAFLQYTWGDATWVDTYKMVTYEPWASPMGTHRWLLIRAEADWSKSSRHEFRISATETEHRNRFDDGVTDTRVESTTNATSASIHLQTNTYSSDFEMREADITGTTNAYILRVNAAYDYTTTNKWLFWAGVQNTTKFNVDFDGSVYNKGSITQDKSPTSTGSLMIGVNAGNNTITGNYNVIIGDTAGASVTRAYNSIHIGQSAGRDNSSSGVGGEGNICIGAEAGMTLDDSFDNIFIGNYAGNSSGDFCNGTIVIGLGAGQSMSGSSGSVVIGQGAGSNMTGDLNTIVGYEAGQLVTGDNNTFLGRYAGRNITSGEKNIMLGYITEPADPTRNNICMIGDTGLDSVQVGINNNDPQYRLDVGGDINTTGDFRVNGSLLGSSWTVKLNETYFQAGNGWTWGGSSWVDTAHPTGNLQINSSTGGWSYPYRPLKVKVTATSSPDGEVPTFNLKTNNTYTIATGNADGTEYEIDWTLASGFDYVFFFEFSYIDTNETQYEITDIQFFDDGFASYSEAATKLLVDKQFSGSNIIRGIHLQQRLVFDVVGSETVTLPEDATEALPAGWQCVVRLEGAGDLTFVTQGTDVIHSPDSLVAMTKQYGEVVVTKKTSGVWELNGELA